MRFLGIEFSRLFIRRELWLIVLIGIIVAGASHIETVVNLNTSHVSNISANNAFMLSMKSGIGQMYVICLLPFIAAIPYSDCFYNEIQQGIAICNLTRTSYRKYLTSKTFIVALSGFIVSILPIIFNLLLTYIAFPCKPIAPYSTGSVYDVSVYDDIKYVVFPKLYMNNQLWNSIVHIIMAGVLGSIYALISFCISLYKQKNYLFQIGVVPIAVIVITILLSLINADKFIPSYYLFINPYIKRNIMIYLMFICASGLVVYLLILKKIKSKVEIL